MWNEKKKRKKEEKEEERDKERDFHRHDVWSKLPLCFTNGRRDLRTVPRFVLTRLCLAGVVPVAARKEAFRWRRENPSEWIKPRRRGTYLSCPMRLTLISPAGTSSFFSNVFGGASSSCDRNVQQTTSGRFQRRAHSKFGKNVPGSCNRSQAWSCDSLRHRSRSGRRTRARQFETSTWSLTFDMATGKTWHCQQERVINDVVLMWTRGVGLRQR